MKNKKIISLFIVFFLICISINCFSDPLNQYVINDFQVFAEINSHQYSSVFKRLVTNVVSQPIYDNFILSVKKKSIDKLGIDLTNHQEMKKIGINIDTPTGVVFSDVFFSQSFYVVIKLTDKDKFFNFLKIKSMQEANNAPCSIISEKVKEKNYTIFRTGNQNRYTITQINESYIISKNNALVQKVVEAVKSGKTITTDEYYKKNSAILGSAFVSIYIKPQVFSQAITAILLITGKAAQFSYNYAFLNIFTNHSLGIFVQPKMLGLNIHSHFDPAQNLGELFQGIEPGNSIGQNIVNHLPANPYLFLHSDTSPSKLLKFLKVVFPAFKDKIESFFQTLQTQLSFNFENDIIDNAGRSFGIALYNFDPTIVILNQQALKTMNAIVYMEMSNPGLLNLALIRLKSNIKNIDPNGSVSTTFIRGMMFYHIKSKINIYVGMFNRYILIGTQKDILSELIWKMLVWSKTGFQKSLRAPEFTKRLENKTILSLYINLQKVFSNSVLPPLVKDYGINLLGFKNMYFSSRMENNNVDSILRLHFN